MRNLTVVFYYNYSAFVTSLFTPPDHSLDSSLPRAWQVWSSPMNSYVFSFPMRQGKDPIGYQKEAGQQQQGVYLKADS